jgi:hypothetical protein
VLLEEWQPFIAVGEALMFDKLAEEDIAADGTQSKGDRIENQPEDDFFCYFDLSFSPARR